MDLPLRALLLGLGWCVGWWLLWRVRAVPVLPAPADGPTLSVVVPARDEERALPALLEGLAGQTRPAAEILVVDDHSEDATAAVARSGGARVVRSEPLPDGWTGKPWAMWQGANAATGDVVVFLDADVEPSSALLERLAPCFDCHGGLLSVQPFHAVRRWWERASAFFNLVAIMGVGIASPRPSRRPTAFGPCMVCRRDRFLEHGSHPSVRGAVLEDVALARRFAAAGESVTAYGGRGLVAFRMYDRPAHLVEGWAKGFAAGAGSIPAGRLLLVIGWTTACLSAGWGIVSATALAVALYAAFAAQLFVMLRQVGRFGIVTALAFPLLGAVFVAVFVLSLVNAARGEVRWKGRAIRVRGARRT